MSGEKMIAVNAKNSQNFVLNMPLSHQTSPKPVMLALPLTDTLLLPLQLG